MINLPADPIQPGATPRECPAAENLMPGNLSEIMDALKGLTTKGLIRRGTSRSTLDGSECY
ncbi:hypothetical protein PbB2_02531 [Candidatus Phycosocius bacilliformis]|uniref:Uncharacterized protein n=1 Tax=Candidatus Phycosocius bacilliformis TaxID=1445552 RepID=A0A2P2ECQ4_9PROT|nr:hypothetical protein PbB2_02531 [Candidatus Phycosocius bacilliformis]